MFWSLNSHPKFGMLYTSWVWESETPLALTPVCSPDLLNGKNVLDSPSDLTQHTLLRDTRNDFWPAWLDGVGLADLSPEHNLYSDSTAMRMQAALDGQGIELGCLSLISEELANGVLVAPFDFVLHRFSFYVVQPKRERIPNKVATFCEWLTEEARAYIDFLGIAFPEAE